MEIAGKKEHNRCKMLGTKTKEEVIELFPKYTILSAYRGSVAHGMYVPNVDPNSIDDIDLIGIHMAPIDLYVGLLKDKQDVDKSYGQYRETVEKFVDEYDLVCYEFKKMMNLLLKSNPNVLTILALDDEHYIHMTEAGQMLIDNRDIFFSKKAYYPFAKYAEDQLKRMTHIAFEGYMGEKRRNLVKQFGYDTKNAAHCIRLLRMCVEFLNTGELKVTRTNDAQELLDIKLGKRSINDVYSEAEYLSYEAKRAFERSPLPDKPDYLRANELTKIIVFDHVLEIVRGEK